jgi:DNA polymerase-1
LPGGDDGVGETVFIPFTGDGSRDKEILQLFSDIFADPGRRLITHDLKIIYKLLFSFGLGLECSVFDTLLAAYLLDADKPAYHLQLLLEEFLGITVRFPEKKSAENNTSDKKEAAVAVNDKDKENDKNKVKDKEEEELGFLLESAAALSPLAETLGRNLEERRLVPLYFQLELPLVPVLAKMELQGIKVEEAVFHELTEEMEADLLELEKEITQLAGQTFNLNSPQQLGYILFEKLKLPSTRKTKTGYSTDAKVLQELSDIHPIAAKISAYRSVAKLKNTYLEGFILILISRQARYTRRLTRQ